MSFTHLIEPCLKSPTNFNRSSSFADGIIYTLARAIGPEYRSDNPFWDSVKAGSSLIAANDGAMVEAPEERQMRFFRSVFVVVLYVSTRLLREQASLSLQRFCYYFYTPDFTVQPLRKIYGATCKSTK